MVGTRTLSSGDITAATVSITTSTLAEGSHPLTVVITDAAGNVSTAAKLPDGSDSDALPDAYVVDVFNDPPTVSFIGASASGFTILGSDVDAEPSWSGLRMTSLIGGLSAVKNGSNTTFSVSGQSLPIVTDLVITDGSNQTPVEVGGKLVTLVLGRDSANLTDMFGSVSGYGLYFGFGGSDTIEGGANGNYIFGGAGNDVIFGGAGNDFISGGSGSDSILLDAGSDTVLFDSLTGADTIADFNSSVDLIQLAKTAMVTLGAVGTLSDAEFKSGAGLTAAPEATTRIFYDLTSGALYYDADGSGSVNAIPLATFTDHPLLTRNNFFIA